MEVHADSGKTVKNTNLAQAPRGGKLSLNGRRNGNPWGGLVKNMYYNRFEVYRNADKQNRLKNAFYNA